ncbi:MAG TPA: sigma-70 family RNA polymerase sigma factor [Ktedonobacterales bacterium]|jgi:RNA polymerase sigma-70 factor (ECF subfamily)|nr:sigma-70 family RNA polymerase sigma factor [Ktedonobacterales bacterium]
MAGRRADDEQAAERALVEKGQRGDRAAFNRLVERHQSGAYALALRMVGDAEAAADITQDAFFAAYRALASFKGGSFRAWLYRIVSNGCFDHFRTQARRPTTSLEAALGDERDGESPGMGSGSRLPSALIDASWDPEGIALRAEQIEQIEAALQKLAPEQRLALILSDIQGLSYEEIARVTNASLGTVKSRIARARGHMRGILARRGELFR